MWQLHARLVVSHRLRAVPPSHVRTSWLRVSSPPVTAFAPGLGSTHRLPQAGIQTPVCPTLFACFPSAFLALWLPPHGWPSTCWPGKGISRQRAHCHLPCSWGAPSVNTPAGFRRLGFNLLISTLAVPFVHGSFSYPTLKSWIPDPRFPIYLDQIHRTKHGSDSEVRKPTLTTPVSSTSMGRRLPPAGAAECCVGTCTRRCHQATLYLWACLARCLYMPM